MIASDRTLRSMYPANDHIQGASIDVHLGDSLLVWPHWEKRDPRIDQSHLWQSVELYNGVWVMHPGRRYLSATDETIRVPSDMAVAVSGRSSWGRDGLEVHRQAGWLDPGFLGTVTLELSVVGSDLVIWPGARVAQLVFHRLDHEALHGYAGKYQNQQAPTPSRSHLDAGVVA